MLASPFLKTDALTDFKTSDAVIAAADMHEYVGAARRGVFFSNTPIERWLRTEHLQPIGIVDGRKGAEFAMVAAARCSRRRRNLGSAAHTWARRFVFAFGVCGQCRLNDIREVFQYLGGIEIPVDKCLMATGCSAAVVA